MTTSVSGELSMVVAYIYEKAFEPIRAELLDLGFDSLAITAVSCSGQGAETTVLYRGATLTNHLRPRFKLECVVSAEDVSTIVDTVRKHARDASASDDPVFVVPVGTPYRSSSDDAAPACVLSSSPTQSKDSAVSPPVTRRRHLASPFGPTRFIHSLLGGRR